MCERSKIPSWGCFFVRNDHYKTLKRSKSWFSRKYAFKRKRWQVVKPKATEPTKRNRRNRGKTLNYFLRVRKVCGINAAALCWCLQRKQSEQHAAQAGCANATSKVRTTSSSRIKVRLQCSWLHQLQGSTLDGSLQNHFPLWRLPFK